MTRGDAKRTKRSTEIQVLRKSGTNVRKKKTAKPISY